MSDSRAKEWSRALEEAHNRVATLERDKVPVWYEEAKSIGGTRTPTAYVTPEGKLYLDRRSGEWDVHDAVALAEWILATFKAGPYKFEIEAK